MKKIAFTIIALSLLVGLGYAQTSDECLVQCQSQSSLSQAYCKEKCNRIQEPYAKIQTDTQQQSLELQKQQIELQKQLLDIQKQSLDMQKQQLELQKQLQPQAKQDAPEKPAQQ